MNDDIKNEFKASVDLAEWIRRDGVPLACGPNEFKAKCPFHDDSTPSFTVFHKDGAWAFHCFGCEAQGDIFEWVMRRQSMSFPRALRAGGGQCRGHAWMVANHEDREARWRGVPVPVKRGQLAHSTTGLAERWHWSRPKVRAFLDELREMCKITFKMDNVATVITVLDYEMFNPAEEQADLIAEQPHTDTKSNTEVELEVGKGIWKWKLELGKKEQGKGKGRHRQKMLLESWLQSNGAGRIRPGTAMTKSKQHGTD